MNQLLFILNPNLIQASFAGLGASVGDWRVKNWTGLATTGKLKSSQSSPKKWDAIAIAIAGDQPR